MVFKMKAMMIIKIIIMCACVLVCVLGIQSIVSQDKRLVCSRSKESQGLTHPPPEKWAQDFPYPSKKTNNKKSCGVSFLSSPFPLVMSVVDSDYLVLPYRIIHRSDFGRTTYRIGRTCVIWFCRLCCESQSLESILFTGCGNCSWNCIRRKSYSSIKNKGNSFRAVHNRHIHWIKPRPVQMTLATSYWSNSE